MHEVLVDHLGGLSLPRKSVVRLTDRPDMTLDVYRGRKTNNTITVDVKAIKQQKQQLQNNNSFIVVTVFYHRITRPTLTVTLHYITLLNYLLVAISSHLIIGVRRKLCNPILVTTFPECLSGTEPWPRTTGAVRPSLSCL